MAASVEGIKPAAVGSDRLSMKVRRSVLVVGILGSLLVSGCGSAASQLAGASGASQPAGSSTATSIASTVASTPMILTVKSAGPVIRRYVDALINKHGAEACGLMTPELAGHYKSSPLFEVSASCSRRVLFDARSRHGARLIRFGHHQQVGPFLGVQTEIRLPDNAGGQTGMVWFWLEARSPSPAIARDGNTPGLFNGGNYEPSDEMAPALPDEMAIPWPAPRTAKRCIGKPTVLDLPANDVVTTAGHRTSAAPWLDIRRLSFYGEPSPCVEIELGAPLRPDTRITVTRDRGEGTLGDAFQVVVGGAAASYSIDGLRPSPGDRVGWSRSGNVLTLHPEADMFYARASDFTVCVTSTASAEPNLPWSNALGDAYPYDNAPC
jgi:hypothetical protein